MGYFNKFNFGFVSRKKFSSIAYPKILIKFSAIKYFF